MTKFRGTTCLVALGLLGFLTWTNVEAQKQTYQQHYGQNPQSQSSSTSYNPANQDTDDACVVDRGQRAECGGQGLSSNQCQDLGCCFDGTDCYFPKKLSVHCTRDGFFIVVVARCETEPSIDADSLCLLGEGDYCSPEASNSLFTIFRFPVHACGTLVTDERGFIVYENILTSAYRTYGGAGSYITRDSHYQATVQCRYIANSTDHVNLQLGLHDPPLSIHAQGPVNVELKLASGECLEKGCTDVTYYSDFYTEDQYPIRKALKDPVYVQVEVLNRQDPSASLLLHRCWATTDIYPHSMPQWDILINGCPNSADSDNIKLVSNEGVNNCKRFMFRMFTFVTPTTEKGPSEQKVYIHCSTSLCLMTDGNACQQPCFLRDTKYKRSIVEEAPKTVVTFPGLVIGDYPKE